MRRSLTVKIDFRDDTPRFDSGVLRMVPGRDRLVLEGCGCFLVFQRPMKTGRAYLVGRPGYHYYGLHVIGSVYKEVEKEQSQQSFDTLKFRTAI